jgi:tubulin polyglutamylase TTLL4
MEAWQQAFSRVPLPYTYVRIPQPNEPPNRSRHPIRYYVNRVMTNLTRDAFTHSGFICTEDSHRWNASWGRQYSMEQYRRCQSWQKVNHFAGAFLMGRKDNLHCRMADLRSRGPGLPDFYPESYLLPGETRLLNQRWYAHDAWIIKPSASSRGRGIRIQPSDGTWPPNEACIVQAYVIRPFLITKRKFDVRIYAYVPSIFPLRIYLHHSGIARFCTEEYNTNDSLGDVHVHLTNFSLNKGSENFVRADRRESVSDSKWSLGFWMDYMRQLGCDMTGLMQEIERVTISTIIAGICEIRKTHAAMIPHRHTSHELYGIDILLDEDLRVHLIEVNISPSFSGLDSVLDYNLKFPLNLDLFRMGRIIDCDPTAKNPCPGVELIDNACADSVGSQRLQAVEAGADPWEDPVFGDFVIVRDFVEETEIQSGFRLVYPREGVLERFQPCFDKIRYQDRVLNTWVSMADERKVETIERHWNVYVDGMQRITASLGTS